MFPWIQFRGLRTVRLGRFASFGALICSLGRVFPQACTRRSIWGGGGQCSCSQVLEIACEGYGDQDSISISTALQLLCTCRCRSAGAAEAFKQLVWFVGRRCDLHFAKVLCGGSTAKLNDMTERQLDKALCKYLMACQKSFANARSVHIAMDASMVAKKPLMFSGAALPDNTGVVLPPWASFCGSILQRPILLPLIYAGFRLVVRV